MDAIDKAAAAFDADIGGAKAKSSSNDNPTERVFDNVGEISDDSEDTNEEIEVSDEVDGDDVDDESSDDESDGADDDEESDEEDQEGAKYTVTVDGEQKEVSLKEALAGYIRTETFHTRLNQLSEVKKVMQTEASKLVDDRKRYVDMIGDLETQIAGILPQEPDWDKLFAEDPKGARDLQVRYEEVKGKLSAISAAKNKALEEQAEEDRRNTAAYARSEFQKFVANNKYSNNEDLQRDVQSMRRTANSLGFSEEEIAAVYDSRMLQVLLKASKYDRMMAAKPKPVGQGRKSIPPGAGSNGTAHKGINRAQRRLSRTGSIEDATSVFEKILR